MYTSDKGRGVPNMFHHKGFLLGSLEALLPPIASIPGDQEG